MKDNILEIVKKHIEDKTEFFLPKYSGLVYIVEIADQGQGSVTVETVYLPKKRMTYAYSALVKMPQRKIK